MLHRSKHFVTFIDAPCGYGKSHSMLESLRQDRKYLLVTPRTSETLRFADRDEETGEMLPMEERRHPDVEVLLTKQSKGTREKPRTKTTHLRELLVEGRNVAITHALFDNLKEEADADLLSGYDIVIDECIDPISTKSVAHRKTLSGVILGEGYATVDEDTGQLRPTEKWDDLSEARYNPKEDEWYTVNALENDLYQEASVGRLVCHDEETLFVVATPPEVLLGGRSLTVMTFMPEAGYLYHYMRKLAQKNLKAYPHIHRYNSEEFTRRATEMVSVELLPTSIRKLNYSAQERMQKKAQRQLGLDVRNFLRHTWDGRYDPETTAVVGPKVMWSNGTRKIKRDVVDSNGCTSRREVTIARPSEMAEQTRLFRKGTFLSPKTRAINSLDHLENMVHCADVHANPKIADFLECNSRRFSDMMAVSETIQVVWRMAVRRREDPKPVKVAFASKRMHTLFTQWQQELRDEYRDFDDFALIEDAA